MTYKEGTITILPIEEGTFSFSFGFELEKYPEIISDLIDFTLIVSG